MKAQTVRSGCGMHVNAEGGRGGGRIFFASAYHALQYCCCDYGETTGKVVELLFLLEVVPTLPATMYQNSKRQIYTGPVRVTKVHVRRFSHLHGTMSNCQMDHIQTCHGNAVKEMMPDQHYVKRTDGQCARDPAFPAEDISKVHERCKTLAPECFHHLLEPILPPVSQELTSAQQALLGLAEKGSLTPSERNAQLEYYEEIIKATDNICSKTFCQGWRLPRRR